MTDEKLKLLKFIVNPNMDYIQADIKHLEQLYLQGLSEEEYKRKKEKFDQTIYIFLDDLVFEEYLLNRLIKKIYTEFANFFSINLNSKDNFINDILESSNYLNLSDDYHLNLLKNYCCNLNKLHDYP